MDQQILLPQSSPQSYGSVASGGEGVPLHKKAPELNGVQVTAEGEGASNKASTSDKPQDAVKSHFNNLATDLRQRCIAQGLDERLCTRANGLAEGDFSKNLDELLDGALESCSSRPEQVSHHSVHRAMLGGLFLLASGSNRWLGLPGLTQWLGSFGAACAVTFSSFCITNLLGAYTVNRMLFEGVTDWKQVATGFVASLPAAVDGVAAFSALTVLGVSWPLALICAGVNSASSHFYFWHFMERAGDFVVGRDPERECLLDRAIWLEAQLLREANRQGVECDLAENGRDWKAIGKTLAQRLINPAKPTCWQRFMRCLPLSSPEAKAKNIIKELLEAKKEGRISHYSIKELHTSALLVRQKGCARLLRGAGCVGLFTLSMAFTWSDLASLVNKLSSVRGASCMAVRGVYSAMQVTGQVVGLAETAATAMLSYENLLATTEWFRKRRWRSQCQIKNLWHNVFFTGGLFASGCFALTLFGSGRTDLGKDPCLATNNIAKWVLPGAAAMAAGLHSWRVGPEILGVLIAVKNLVCQTAYSVKGRCCHSQPIPAGRLSNKGAIENACNRMVKRMSGWTRGYNNGAARQDDHSSRCQSNSAGTAPMPQHPRLQ